MMAITTQEAIFNKSGIGEKNTSKPVTSANRPYIGVLNANWPKTAPKIAGKTKSNEFCIDSGTRPIT